jgi:hypothetical protein
MADRYEGARLWGRGRECEALDGLIAGARGGQSQVLVVRGEAGVGKSALLDYVERRAEGCRVTRAAGVESEMELAYAGLHQLCAPLLGSLGHLPAPQRDALGTALGLAAGEAPDRFLVGLALLGLLSEACGDRPLVCVVDDAQWLDRASARWPSRSSSCSPCVSPTTTERWRAWPSWWSAGCVMPTHGRCWRRRSPVGSTNACGTGSSPRRGATRWH